MIGTTIFAYVVGALVAIILNLNPTERLRKQQLQNLNFYLTDFQSASGLRKSVRLHLGYRQKVKSVFGEQLLAELPPGLRMTATSFIHRLTVPQVPLVCKLEREHRGALAILFAKLKPANFSRRDAVYHPMIGLQREMCFVVWGTLEVLPASTDDQPPPPAISSRGDSSTKAGADVAVARGAPAARGTAVAQPHQQDGHEKPLGADGRASGQALQRHSAGDHCGEAMLLVPESFICRLRVEVRARTSVQLLTLTRPDFNFVKLLFPQVAKALEQCLAESFKRSCEEWLQPMDPEFDLDRLMEEVELVEPGPGEDASQDSGPSTSPGSKPGAAGRKKGGAKKGKKKPKVGKFGAR